MGDAIEFVSLGPHTVTSIAAGAYHTCAVLDNGNLKVRLIVRCHFSCALRWVCVRARVACQVQWYTSVERRT